MTTIIFPAVFDGLFLESENPIIIFDKVAFQGLFVFSQHQSFVLGMRKCA
jgi:hypothetical protein